MTDDGHPDDLVGAYVIEACPADEAQSVAEHANSCPTCAAEIAELSRVAEWIGVSATRAPAPELRSRVLSAALATRPAGRPSVSPVAVAAHTTPVAEVRRLVEPYRVQVGELDRLLSGLSQPQWQLATGPHRSVRDLMVHLLGNDAPVATAAGLDPSELDNQPSTSDIRLGWREQAHAIMAVVTGQGAGLLRREVRLAGRRGIRRPVREAMIQRGFETWIHAEDVRAALHLPPQTPSAQQVSDIVDFALRLLPAAMDATGLAHPDKAVRVVLTGDGGGTRLVDLSAASQAPGTVVAELSLPAERFCRVLAGRLVTSSTDAEVDGDSSAANDFLTVAATMGCD